MVVNKSWMIVPPRRNKHLDGPWFHIAVKTPPRETSNVSAGLAG
jgi:hypothetical protein